MAAAAVYELAPGSIVDEAIAAAGGFTADANVSVVNLAQSLRDGAHIYVPARDEAIADPVQVVNNPCDFENERGAGSPAGPTGLVNINTASLEQLDTLPGVGPSTAQKIVNHRDEIGPFSAIEEIMDVPGIGEAKFASFKDLITVEGE